MYIYIYIYTDIVHDHVRQARARPSARSSRRILYYTIPYYVIPYHTIPYHTILYYTIRYDTIRYDTILYDTIRYYAMLCHAITLSGGLAHGQGGRAAAPGEGHQPGPHTWGFGYNFTNYNLLKVF